MNLSTANDCWVTRPIRDTIESKNFTVNLQNELGTTHLKQVTFEANGKKTSDKLKVTMKNSVTKTGETQNLNRNFTVVYTHPINDNFRVKVKNYFIFYKK
jgi:hypothetical protein